MRNPYHRSIYGIGYLGQGEYATQHNNIESKLYIIWRGMFYRCYSISGKDNEPTYIGCSVDERWHNFQVFAKWYEDNWKEYMSGWQLDKDILKKGNKVYSPETCTFVPQEINGLFAFKREAGKDLPNGVSKRRNRFLARLNRIHLGTFDTKEEAFECYKFHKEMHIKEVADKWKLLISPQIYQSMYNHKIIITE